MIKILISGPKSYFSYNLIKKLTNKNIELFLIIRNKKEINKINNYFNHKFINYIYLHEIIKNNTRLKYLNFDFIINTINKYDDGNNSFKEIYLSNVEIPIKIIKFVLNKKSQFIINIDTILHKQTNFYALTKYIFRKILINNFNYKYLKIINIQFHNFYSYNENDNNLISKLIKYSRLNKVFQMTNGTQIRDFIHIDDATNLIIQIVKNKKNFNTKNNYNFNIGGNQPIKVKSLSNLIRRYYNSKSKLNLTNLIYPNKFAKINYFSKNNELKKIIQWKPKHNIKKYFKK